MSAESLRKAYARGVRVHDEGGARVVPDSLGLLEQRWWVRGWDEAEAADVLAGGRGRGVNMVVALHDAQEALRRRDVAAAEGAVQNALDGYRRFEETVNGWVRTAEQRGRRIEELEARLAEAAP